MSMKTRIMAPEVVLYLLYKALADRIIAFPVLVGMSFSLTGTVASKFLRSWTDALNAGFCSQPIVIALRIISFQLLSRRGRFPEVIISI